MAAILVTVGAYNSNSFADTGAGRVLVRTSAGIPYVIGAGVVGAFQYCVIFKGNSSTPTAFNVVAAFQATSAYSSVGFGGLAAAIDSSDIIHIVYAEDNAAAPSIMYRALNTADDTWVADPVDIIADTGADITSTANCQTAIAIDSNNIPHIAYLAYTKVGGTTQWTILYNNRIGGAWNASSLEVEGVTANKACKFPEICIDADNKPCIVYSNESDNDVTVAIGNANDAASFTLYDVDADHETTSGTNRASIAIDSSGNHYVTYRDESDTYIYINKHIKADAWTTWQTRQTNSKNGINPQLAIDGTNIYIFYEEDTDNDIVYDKYSGTWGSGTWRGETPVLETGSFNTVKANRQLGTSYGSIIEYVFLDETATPDIWYNSISLTTSQVKKSMGVLQASIKKIEGVTIVTVKKLAGVTNV
jgi:uncharacterized protein (UPF0254 family)